MIDPQETHHLDTATRLTYLLRRAPDGVAILHEAIDRAGLPSDTFYKSGPAVTLIQLSRSWPWTDPPEEQTLVEFVRARQQSQLEGRKRDFRSLLSNRPGSDPGKVEPPTPEVEEVLAVLHNAKENKVADDWVKVWSPGAETGCVNVSRCSPSWHFDSPGNPGIFIHHAGEEGADPEAFAKRKAEHRAKRRAFKGILPAAVRILLTYPLQTPYLIHYEMGNHSPTEWWDVWELVEAICTAYERAYSEAEKYGVWGHDIGDLAIEGIRLYLPLGLILPSIGS